MSTAKPARPIERPSILIVTASLTKMSMHHTKSFESGDYGVLRAIVETTSDAIFVKDLEGRYILVNTACANFLGKSKDEILGRRDADLYPAETARHFIADDEEVLKSETTLVFEGIAQSPSGQQAYRVTKGVVHNEQGEVVGVFGISHDMTERKRADEERLVRVRAEAAQAEAEAAAQAKDNLLQELRESEETARRRLAELEATYNAAPVGLCAFDRELRYVRINERLAEINGIAAADHIGRTVREVVPDLADDIETVFRQVMETGEPVLNFELVGETKALPGVERIWLEGWYPLKDEKGEVIGLNVVAEEITERKRSEAEREDLLARERVSRDEAEKRLRESIKLAGVYRALARSLELSEVTATICQAVRELLGADGAAFIVREGDEVYYADTDAIAPLWKGQRFPASACVSGWSIIERQPAVIENIYIDPRVPVEAYRQTFVNSLAMVPVRAVNPVGAIGAYWAGQRRASDDEVRLMQALASAADLAFANAQLFEQTKKARLEAEAANRLKDEFLATLSHELRTPLTAIIGWAHLLEGEVPENEAAAQAVGIIRRNAEQQKRIVEDILDASRIIAGKIAIEVETVHLTRLVQEAIASVQPAAAAKGIELSCMLDPRADEIQGDPHRLLQVIWNLLSNAIKFTPAGGRVKVEVERLLTHVRITINDTGQGIASDFLPFVFDRFRQADGSSTRQHGGLGLGLSIVKYLIEAHGGAVHAYSAGEGQGTTFTVDLPLPAELVKTLPVSRRLIEELIEHSGETDAGDEVPLALVGVRVLLVEDDEDALSLLALLLRKQGAEVATTTTAAAALEMLEKFSFDILVSDIGMPGEDGYSLIRRVRGRGEQMPAIALTAYAGDADRQLALRAGFQLHMAKPVEPTILIEAMMELVGRASSAQP